MIHHVYIIDSSGKLLFHKHYSGASPADADLTTGFLSALTSFALDLGKGVIESLTMRNLKFVYGHFGYVLVIFSVDVEDEINRIKNKIKRVGETFLLKFGEILPNWKGKRSIFNTFNKDIDNAIKSTVKVVFMGPAEVGKTTICNLIKNSKIPLDYEPTIGLEINPISDIAFNEELQIICWDLSGQEQYHTSWDDLIEDSDLIFLVNDSTIDSIMETKNMYEKYKPMERTGVLFYAIANKQDLKDAFNPEDVQALMEIPTYGLIAINPQNRDKIIHLIKTKVSERLGEKFTEIKQQISERREIEEIIKSVGKFKSDFLKLLDIEDPIFRSINFWLDKLFYYPYNKLNKEDSEELSNTMKIWNHKIQNTVKSYVP